MKKIMKMFIAVLAIMTVFGLASCDKKDNVTNPYSVLGDFSVADETNVYSLAENTKTKLDFDYTKSDSEEHRNSYIKKAIKNSNLNKYQKLVITLTGLGDVKIELVAGSTTLAVYLNVTTVESTYEWNLMPHKDVLNSVTEIRVYGAAGRVSTTGYVTISRLAFNTNVADGFIIQTDYNNIPSNVNEYDGVSETFDVNAKWAENGEDGVYTIEQDAETKATEVIYKKNEGNEWSCIISQVRGKLENFKYLVVVAKGTDGKKMMIKVEGEGGVAKEQTEKFDGTEQTFVLDISTFTNEQRNAISKVVIFGAPNAIQDGRFTIYEAYMSKTSPIEIEETIKNKYNGTDEEFEISKYWYDGGDKVYTVEEVTDGLKVSFTKKGTYSTLKAYLEGDFSKFKYLVIEASSEKGSSVLLKAANGCESLTTTLSSEKSVVYVDISKVENLSTLSEVIIFGNPGSESAGEFILHKAYFANEVKGVEMPKTNTYDKFYKSFDVNHYWVDNNTGVYTVTEEGTKTVVNYTKHTGCDWATFKTTMENVTDEFSYVKLVLKGTGTQILVKPQDNGAYEKWVDLTGEEQTVYAAIPANMTELHIFCEPGKANGETGTLEIISAELVRDVMVEDKSIDVVNTFYTSDVNSYTISAANKGIKVDYTVQAGAWPTIRTIINGENSDITAINLVFKGVKGSQILVKINDQKELWINDLTGEEQTVVIDETTVDGSGANVLLSPLTEILIFIAPNPSKEVTGTFELKSVELSKVVKTTPIVGSYSDCSNEGFYQIKENAEGTEVTVGYDVAKKGYYYFQLTLDEKMTTVDKLYMTFRSSSDVRILIKPNDDGSLQEYVDVTTTDFTFVKAINGDLESVLVFVSPEVAGKMGNLTITNVGVTLVEGPITNEYTSGESFNVNRNWHDGGNEVYDVTMSGTDTIVTFDKGSFEWPSAKVLISGVTNEFNYLVIKATGTADLVLKVKSVNDSGYKETDITLSETEKEFYVEIVEGVKEILIFAAPGATKTTGTFTIKSADLKYATNVTDEMTDMATALRTNNLFTVSNDGTVTSVSYDDENKGDWDSVYGNVYPFVSEGKKIVVNVTSEAVKEVLVKFNNSNNYQTEISIVEGVGTATITNLPEVITEIRVFADFNSHNKSGLFKISAKVEEAEATALTWTAKDNNGSVIFTFEEKDGKIEVTFDKTDTYQSMKLEPSTGVKGTKVKLTLSADAARKVMVKPNDNYVYQTTFDVTTDAAEFVIELGAEETIANIVFMVDTDVPTSSGSFTIHSIVIE